MHPRESLTHRLIRFVPTRVIGTTGAPDAIASHPTPVFPRYNRPSRDRVPSG